MNTILWAGLATNNTESRGHLCWCGVVDFLHVRSLCATERWICLKATNFSFWEMLSNKIKMCCFKYNDGQDLCCDKKSCETTLHTTQSKEIENRAAEERFLTHFFRSELTVVLLLQLWLRPGSTQSTCSILSIAPLVPIPNCWSLSALDIRRLADAHGKSRSASVSAVAYLSCFSFGTPVAP